MPLPRTPMRKYLQAAGYHYKGYLGDGEHVLLAPNGQFEVWFSNRDTPSYGLYFKNTVLEFARSASKEEIKAIDGQNGRGKR